MTLLPSALHPALRLNFTLVFFLAAILLVANTAYEWPFAIRFMYSPLNYWGAGLLALSIPISIIFLSESFTHRIWRWLTITVGVILLIPTLLFSVLQLTVDFTLENSLAIGPTTYRVYIQESASPLTQPFTVVRKELDTIFGVKFVRTIWTDESYGHAILRSINSSTIEVEIDGNRTRLNI